MPAEATAAALTGGLLLWLASAPALASCWQLHDRGPVPLADCQLSDSGLVLGPAAVAGLQHDHRGLAAIQAGSGFYLHHQDGRLLQVPAMDNGPDTFQHGLVRGLVAGRYGFFATRLQARIAPVFDGALPFDAASGTAWVCKGCQPATAGADGQQVWHGGHHWQIDQHGKALP